MIEFLLVISPDSFQQFVEGWLKAIVAVFLPLTALAGTIFAFVAYIKSRVTENTLSEQKDRIDRQDVRVTAQSATIARVAMAVPPPNGSPAKVDETQPPR